MISIFQLYFLGRADKTARISADAAKKSADAAKASADALPRVERAYVFVEIKSNSLAGPVKTIKAGGLLNAAARLASGGGVRSDERPLRYMETIEFRNVGKTPAVITEIRADLEVSNGEPKEVAPYLKASRREPESFILGSFEQTSKIVIDSFIDMVKTDVIAIANGTRHCHLYGVILYTDIFGDARETAFCFRTNLDGQLRPYGGPNYNYRN